MGIPESKLREYYEKTAGEIEARDSAQRSWRTGEARKEKRPDIDRTDVVFADDSVVGNSIVEPFTDKNGNRFDNAVLLDTSDFNNVSPRNWWKVLKNHIENRVDKATFIMPVIDENGQSQMLEFAKKSDWTVKNGNNPHAVLSELYGTNDNISKLSVIHIDEIIDVSEEGTPYYSQSNNHGWLDANGWLHRTANVINIKNGNIYQITMDIAKTNDGRCILYALKGKTKKVGNADVNSLVVKTTSGSEQNSNFVDILPQNSEKSSEKKQYSLSNDNITEESTGYGYGETYFTMSYTKDGKVVGKLEYGEYEEQPNVKMIEVAPEYRRQGIGTKLLQKLQSKYPGEEINFGMATPDGMKL